MKNFFHYLTTHKIPNKDTLRTAVRRPLSWYGVGLYALLCSIAVIAYITIAQINQKFVTTIPARGGTVTEGMIGAPRLINPVLASTETDTSLTKLLYSGLMRETVAGTIVPDLAESATTSPDGLTYTFTLRDKLTWSDGKPLTANDVVFTYNKRALFVANSYWQQVSVTSPDPKTVVFTIPSPRADFLQKVTLGILPMHVWKDVTDEEFETTRLNLKPVGSGPFAFVRLVESDGIVREIVLKRNRHYVGTKSYLDRYDVLFFANQSELKDALSAGSISMTASATPETAHFFADTYTIDTVASSTILALFQSKNATLFSTQTLSVLNAAIDKARILDTIDYGYGILPDTQRISLEEARAALHSLGFNTRADGTLEKNGTPIGFSVAIENDPSVVAAAHAFAQALADIGISITIKAFDPGMFQDVVARNEYQFFFASLKQEDIPASYDPSMTLYTTSYPILHTPTLHIPTTPVLHTTIDRYRESNQWYMRTNDVWKLFTN